MAYQQHCDRCKRFVRFVTDKQIQEQKGKLFLCKACIEMEEKITTNVERFIKRAQNETIQIGKRLKSQITEAVEKGLKEEK